MRTLILAMALAMAATSAQAVEKPKFEAVSPKSPKEILTCYLDSVDSAPQVTELADGYMLIERLPINSRIQNRFRITGTSAGAFLQFWESAGLVKSRRIPVVEACAKV